MLHSLTELLRHERDFTANASHQLRTPLTGLQLTLEAGLAQDDDALLRPALEEALATTRRLHGTVEEVLRLSRSPGLPGTRVPSVPVARLMGEIEDHWYGLFARDGRRLLCTAGDTPDDARVPAAPVAEILGILLDNARVHGRGIVHFTVRDLGDALAFDVADEGAIETTRPFERGHTGDGEGEGIGLALARDLTVTLGGRLSLTGRRPTTFTVLVPVRQDGTEDRTGTATTEDAGDDQSAYPASPRHPWRQQASRGEPTRGRRFGCAKGKSRRFARW